MYISKKGNLLYYWFFFVELRFIRWIFILDALCSTFPLRSSSAKAEAEAEALHSETCWPVDGHTSLWFQITQKVSFFSKSSSRGCHLLFRNKSTKKHLRNFLIYWKEITKKKKIPNRTEFLGNLRSIIWNNFIKVCIENKLLVSTICFIICYPTDTSNMCKEKVAFWCENIFSWLCTICKPTSPPDIAISWGKKT